MFMTMFHDAPCAGSWDLYRSAHLGKSWHLPEEAQCMFLTDEMPQMRLIISWQLPEENLPTSTASHQQKTCVELLQIANLETARVPQLVTPSTVSNSSSRPLDCLQTSATAQHMAGKA